MTRWSLLGVDFGWREVAEVAIGLPVLLLVVWALCLIAFTGDAAVYRP